MAYTRLDRLRSRRTDPLFKSSGVNEVYARLAEDDAIRYAIGAMQPIDPAYTERTYEEGLRVQAHLDPGLRGAGLPATFEFQGSVTSDTHILAHSDIDLIALDDRSTCLEPVQHNPYPYHGDPVADLRQQRSQSVRILNAAFPQVTIDQSGPRALSLTGGSLRRKVDVVSANWWDTLAYAQSGQKTDRGIQVLDANQGVRVPNKPFLHNALIDLRDRQTNGHVRKVIRLLKSLKYDADTSVPMSSYDIASIVYRMPDRYLVTPAGFDLQLVSNAEQFLRLLLSDPTMCASLLVPNEMRPIFGAPEGATETGLRRLHEEVARLLQEIHSGMQRSFRKLEEARIPY